MSNENNRDLSPEEEVSEVAKYSRATEDKTQMKRFIRNTVTGKLEVLKDIIETLPFKADLVDGKVPASQLPSYVDDVIEGYLYLDEFYYDAAHQRRIEPERDKIYVDMTTGYTYRWGGTEYVQVGGQDLSGYYTKTETDILLNQKQDTIDSTHKLPLELVDIPVFEFSAAELTTLKAGEVATLSGLDPRSKLLEEKIVNFTVTGGNWDLVADKIVNDSGVIAFIQEDYLPTSDKIVTYFLTFTAEGSDFKIALLDKRVADGAQVNTIEGIKLNGVAISPDANKVVDILINTNIAFPVAWPTSSATTTKQFCDAVNADATAIAGKSYLGEVRFSDLPSTLVNAEIIVEVMQGSGTSNKVIHLVLSSGNLAPYKWEYTYWANGVNVSGWIGFQPELTAGANIQINGTTISATDTTYGLATISSSGLMPTLGSSSVVSQSQTTKFLREDGTWAAPSYTQDTDLNTWRNIKVNGIEKLGTGTDTGALDLTAGTNINLTESSGVVTIAFNGTIPSISLNGTASTNPTFYAATTAGTSGKFLKSSGSGAPTWDDASSVTFVDWS